MDEKTCHTCGETKPLSEFHRNRAKKDGLAGSCKVCLCSRMARYRSVRPDLYQEIALRSLLRRQYGMTLEEYQEMNAQQDGRCAICGGPPIGKDVRLSVDHCRDTGVVRGLLCIRCNTAIGSLLHKTELLESAIDYLHRTDPKYTGEGQWLTG